MTTSNYENSEVKKKIDENMDLYNTKKMIRILLAIDELDIEASSLKFFIKDDINKFGEKVVLENHRNRIRVENFFKLQSQVYSLIHNNKYELENFIKYLSKIINKKEGE